MRELALAPAEGTLKVLLLGAHPDDIEIGCFGTLDLLRRSPASVQVRWAVLSGSGQRSGEAKASATAILDGGFDDWTFHQGDLPDAYFPAHWSRVKEWLAELGRGFRPGVVLTHHRADRHQDHRLVGELTWNLFRESLILEYEVPKYDGELGSPNAYVPMTAEVCGRKADHLLRSFPSQTEKPWFTAETFSALARLRGMECATPSGYAEAFHVRKLILSS